MTIKVKIENKYGRDRIYPVCDTGKLFLRFRGVKCLSKEDINTIKALGFTVEVVAPVL
jgi:hypothetical protein